MRLRVRNSDLTAHSQFVLSHRQSGGDTERRSVTVELAVFAVLSSGVPIILHRAPKLICHQVEKGSSIYQYLIASVTLWD